MPTPEIHPSTTTTTLPSSLLANQCAPSAGFCGYYPPLCCFHVHILIHIQSHPPPPPIPPSPSFRPIHTWPATSAAVFSSFYLSPNILQLDDTRYPRGGEKKEYTSRNNH
ncbi:GM17866 [Drosophila sechellia]|uniref:GM17866 n=1 Tax=Drosophila sechellia TaxID=7238 RepID=B4I294_DROSE|nr:GM17866 [Drosophila sechellia]